MKEAMKLLLIVFMYSCAVQGPIPGGEVDKTGPQLIRVYPENNSTTLQENDRITFFFNLKSLSFIFKTTPPFII